MSISNEMKQTIAKSMISQHVAELYDGVDFLQDVETKKKLHAILKEFRREFEDSVL